ncbi:MAG: beta-ribofuranosylaminobenzene 5'-phosphate synthase family protein [Burkholderiaceae bacterium]
MRRDPDPSPLLEPAPEHAALAWGVRAPARLHLGFLDPAGTLGRRYGSLGLAIDGFDTVVHLRRAARDHAGASSATAQAALPQALAHLDALRRATGRHDNLQLLLDDAPPAHAGFGSGTQLALAVGRAFARLHGSSLSSRELARITGRGLRSGVGIAAFDVGGLVLDGGPLADGAPAPLLARLALPPAWRIVLALDPQAQGLSGAAEQRALAGVALPPPEAAAEICHQVLMRVLPGAAGAEFEPFAAGVSRMQAILGAHFAAAQHGSAFTSGAVQRVIESIARHTAAACGQSSWGPTGFAVLPSLEVAEQALARARADGAVDPSLQVVIVRPREHGATLVALPDAG